LFDKEIKSILFVCLGNICRSPLAEGIAKKRAQEFGLDLALDSAGTGNWHVGEHPCNDSIKVAKLNSVDISNYKARQVTHNDFKDFDLIVTMDSQNKRDLDNRGLKGSIKIADFRADGADIPDPYFFNGFEGFPKVYEMIDEGIVNILKKIKENL